MRSIQKWAVTLAVALAAFLGSMAFNLMIHRDALAREGSLPQATSKWQITAVAQGDNRYCVFIVNQETGETFKHDSNGGMLARVIAPMK